MVARGISRIFANFPETKTKEWKEVGEGSWRECTVSQTNRTESNYFRSEAGERKALARYPPNAFSQ